METGFPPERCDDEYLRRIARMRFRAMRQAALAAVLAAVSVSGAAAGGPVPGNPLVEIAAGPFVFGSDVGLENERPRRSVEGKAFAMNQTEITNAQYQSFTDATGHRPPFYGSHPILGLPDHPVVGVSFADAAAFCAHYGLRLPSEREYERAARGPHGARFPWGDAPPDRTRVNRGSDRCCGENASDGFALTAPALSFPEGKSEDSLFNLVGNVWEWTRDPYALRHGETPTENDRRYRVLRGGAWNSDPAHLTTTYRLAYDPDFRFAANGGFRCVRSQD
jgi:iron(II)-dependent oxidoreductase